MHESRFRERVIIPASNEVLDATSKAFYAQSRYLKTAGLLRPDAPTPA